MFHYKTVMCPFNLTYHDKKLCVYAHNWQDYRRNPDIFDYDPVPCKNWKLDDFIVNYEDGCKDGLRCRMSHGWKELEYNPKEYRVRKCPNMKKCVSKGDRCPFYHT